MVMLVVSMIAVLVIMFIIMISFMSRVMKSQVTSATSHLDELAGEYAKKEAEVRKQLDDVKRQSQEIIANAQKEAAALKESLEKNMQEEKAKVLAEAHQHADEVIKQADNARLALLADMNNRIDEKTVGRAVELLRESIPENIRRDVHRVWFESLVNSSYEHLDRLKIPQGSTEVKVVTAFALDDGQRQRLKDKLQEKLGFDVTIAEEVDAGIIAGLVVSIGSLFLDGSLKFKIEEVARGKQQGG
ncbi:MAG TPA: F0F1 ATP synthase subunit delta [Candidatus Omnitrophota bacterium]|nr:F0F1 ATP synthase subunit delta [Candidatus Omnitrophota bacterium]